MTDYLKERLNNADYLLEQMKQADRNVTGPLSAQGTAREVGSSMEDEKTLLSAAWGRKSESENTVYNLKNQGIKVNRYITSVNNRTTGTDTAEELERKNGNLLPNMVGEWSFSLRTGGVLEREDAQERGGAQDKERGESWRGSALATELKQLAWATDFRTRATVPKERQGGFLVSHTGPQTQRFYQPNLVEGPGAEWDSRGSLTGSGSGGGQPWVEQADRAFRRDSRRYDGGFYLY